MNSLKKVISWGLVDLNKNKVISTFSTRKEARAERRYTKSNGHDFKIVRFQAQEVVR